MEVWRASQENVDVVIVNPGVILGAGFWKTGSGAMFSKINKGMPFYSEGITGFVDVLDVVKIMIQLMNSSIKNERYILVSENVSFKTVFKEIALKLNKKEPSVKATKLLSEIGWRLEWVKSIITNKPPVLTKQSAKSIHNKHFYASEKIKNELNYQFKPVMETINEVCELFKKN